MFIMVCMNMEIKILSELAYKTHLTTQDQKKNLYPHKKISGISNGPSLNFFLPNQYANYKSSIIGSHGHSGQSGHMRSTEGAAQTIFSEYLLLYFCLRIHYTHQQPKVLDHYCFYFTTRIYYRGPTIRLYHEPQWSRYIYIYRPIVFNHRRFLYSSRHKILQGKVGYYEHPFFISIYFEIGISELGQISFFGTVSINMTEKWWKSC